MRIIATGTVVFSILCAFSAPGWSAGKPSQGLYNKKVYNAETKSYFELYSSDASDPKWKDNVRDFGHIKWQQANELVRKRWFKGVRGRLAVVKSRQTHEFLKKNFRPNGPAWIGLRYWCRFRKLQWVTGEIHKLNAFQAWGPVWNIAGAAPHKNKGIAGCSAAKRDFLPVHYWRMQDGFFWNANARLKEWNQVFIEYPTGKE